MDSPTLRSLGSGLLAAGVIFAVVAFYMHWPLPVAVAIGAVFLVASLMVIGSLSDEGLASADAAWKQASADLARGHWRETKPGPPPRPKAANSAAGSITAAQPVPISMPDPAEGPGPVPGVGAGGPPDLAGGGSDLGGDAS